jgi:hypothetical protein
MATNVPVRAVATAAAGQMKTMVNAEFYMFCVRLFLIRTIWLTKHHPLPVFRGTHYNLG